MDRVPSRNVEFSSSTTRYAAKNSPIYLLSQPETKLLGIVVATTGS
ncbi:hypothetical protein M6B38_116925 [Iris pallida]|uniref:Uncharacterized protein n=1 Tax=Iris pallida TaxID=29817 RepID=A0AAX6F528_IRIPA|nr:hypothetical protein M6B38_153135 [Iris pallida]KAJ6843877.1 hypothetical protein M6B38_116925 [Iris pallida]